MIIQCESRKGCFSISANGTRTDIQCERKATRWYRALGGLTEPRCGYCVRSMCILFSNEYGYFETIHSLDWIEDHVWIELKSKEEVQNYVGNHYVVFSKIKKEELN